MYEELLNIWKMPHPLKIDKIKELVINKVIQFSLIKV